MNSSDYYTAKEIKKLGFKKVGKNLQIKKSAQFFFCKNIVIGNNVMVKCFICLRLFFFFFLFFECFNKCL